MTGEAFASLEVSVERPSVFVDEFVEIRFRVVLEEAFAETQLVQLFRRELDLPVQVRAPWLEGTDELELESAEPAAPASGPRVALGSDVLHTTPQPSARAGERVLELARTYRVLRTGTVTLEPAQLRFTYATAFEDDPFRGRIPADRLDAYVLAAPLTLDVRSVPEEGRPHDFGGAVGHFEVSATAEPRDVSVGESVRWTLAVDGEGYLGGIEAPRLDAVEGFQVQGWVEEPRARGRAFVYDLAPTSHRTNAIPAFSYAYFDPDAATYRVARTQPITVLVRPRASLAAPTEAPAPLPAESGGPTAPRPQPTSGDGQPAAPLWIAGAVLLGAWIWMRTRRGDDSGSD